VGETLAQDVLRTLLGAALLRAVAFMAPDVEARCRRVPVPAVRPPPTGSCCTRRDQS
jgi:hypothetical protein